jgi:membrane protease YdiL (CAAX protease family)
MQEANQGPAEEVAPAPPRPDGVIAPPGGEAAILLAAAGAAAAVPAGPPIMPGLWTWFTIIGALGLAGILWGQAELALSVTLAGAFVAAHAADRDPGLNSLHRLLSVLLVAGGATIFALLAFWLATQSAAGPVRPLAVGIAGGGAVLCLLTALRPFSDGLAAAFFRTAEPTHTLRLGARLVMMVLLFAFPGWAAFPGILDSLAESGRPLLDTGQLLGSVVGLSVLALGAVGFLIRRDARATFDRLGLRALRPAHYGVVALGVAALYFLNTGTEGLQQRWFPDLWDHDQRMSRLIARGLGLGGGLLLGVSAGVGEELAMRGALQPRLGVVLTSLAFAALHVHYSWFGVASIFLLGLLLGVIRDRTSTTVAILVHSLYDIAAVFTAGGAAR